MNRARIRYGCQTYTWQMSFDRYAGQVEHIVDVIKASGMRGMEPEQCMLGAFAEQPARLREVLAERGVKLVAFCLVGDWRGAAETASERANADATISMLAGHFPDCLLALCQMPGADRDQLTQRQNNALACINAIAKRASGAGIVAAFHPNSPAGSVFRTADDYELLLAGLDSRYLGFIPDAGHIAKGGMDPVRVISEAIGLVRHVHFKDMDAQGAWVEMGRGIIDFPGIVQVLTAANYRGWIMVEDESALAEHDPDAATMANGRYVTSILAPRQLRGVKKS
jgi:inosose dehydratase